jgi:hypothetical protein
LSVFRTKLTESTPNNLRKSTGFRKKSGAFVVAETELRPVAPESLLRASDPGSLRWGKSGSEFEGRMGNFWKMDDPKTRMSNANGQPA